MHFDLLCLCYCAILVQTEPLIRFHCISYHTRALWLIQRTELGTRVRDSDSSILELATCLRLACNDLRLDLKDLRLDLGLEVWWLATCTSAHFIHRLKTKPSVNSLINNGEHLLLIMHSAKSYQFFRVSSSTAMECLLSHDHNAHEWPTKHWAIRLIANFHWFSWLFVSNI